ncbi:cell division protein SepF [Candidatus Woesearchaeota archaeon]|nr:cell division protein SepF [Candidatus Woesearchaeota archaeon]
MKETLKKIFSGFKKDDYFSDENTDDYVEIDAEANRDPKAKVLVRPFVITDFADIKPALDSLREGYTIALLNIRPLKEKDIIELKRAVNKLKKTCDAIEGDIAGFGEDWIVVTPNFAQVYRSQQISEVQQ